MGGFGRRRWRLGVLAPLDAVDDGGRLAPALLDRRVGNPPQGHPLRAGRPPGLNDIEFALFSAVVAGIRWRGPLRRSRSGRCPGGSHPCRRPSATLRNPLGQSKRAALRHRLSPGINRPSNPSSTACKRHQLGDYLTGSLAVMQEDGEERKMPNISAGYRIQVTERRTKSSLRWPTLRPRTRSGVRGAGANLSRSLVHGSRSFRLAVALRRKSRAEPRPNPGPSHCDSSNTSTAEPSSTSQPPFSTEAGTRSGPRRPLP